MFFTMNTNHYLHKTPTEHYIMTRKHQKTLPFNRIRAFYILDAATRSTIFMNL